MDDRDNPELNVPVPVAEDNSAYFEAVYGVWTDGVQTAMNRWRCKECSEIALTVLNIHHQAHCQVWLRMRLESLIVKNRCLKFQITKLVMASTKSYPTYVCNLVAPFVIEIPTPIVGRTKKVMLDARVPITMTKAELNDEKRDETFKKKRIEATHSLLDLVEKGEVPVYMSDRTEMVKPVCWGTIKDCYPEKIITEV